MSGSEPLSPASAGSEGGRSPTEGKRSGGLQARLGKSLNVSTAKPTGRKRIEAVNDFEKRYEIGEEVMPSTHKHMEVRFAKRVPDGLEVVIKLRYKPHCFKGKDDERDWRESTEFMLNLPQNAGVAKLHEVLEDDRAFYIVTERVKGMDLFEMLEHNGNVSLTEGKELIRQLLEALAHLHDQGAVHKDLKLENIMVDTEAFKYARRNSNQRELTTPQSVKVIDFDTVEQWEPQSPAAKEVLGTDQYIAQEAYAGHYSPLSDVFAIGVIAYRLLTGKFPFNDELFDDEPGENWVGSPKMKEIRGRLKHTKIDWSGRAFQEDPGCLDLVQKMLAYQELDRPLARDALNHRWFTGRDSPDQKARRTSNEGKDFKGSISAFVAEKNVAKKGSSVDFQADADADVPDEAGIGDGHRKSLLR